MKRLLWRWVKFYSLPVLALIIILTAEPSCNKDDSIIERPSATFILNGTVLSAKDSLPLKDILVIMLSDTIAIDTATTDLNGKFELIDSLGIPAEVSYFINFKKADKELKSTDGSIDSTMIFRFKDLTFINGDGRWYSGETSKEMNVFLKSKKID